MGKGINVMLQLGRVTVCALELVRNLIASWLKSMLGGSVLMLQAHMLV